MKRQFVVDAHFVIVLNLDDEVIARCVENHDDSGTPQPDNPRSGGWRNLYYDLRTPEQVAEHLAYNLGIRQRDLSSLDGWADLGDGLADASVLDAEYTARVPLPPNPTKEP